MVNKNKNELKNFFTKLLISPQRRLNFLLFSVFLLILPVQNSYASLEFEVGRPVIRQLDFKVSEPETYPVHTGTPAPALSTRSAIVVDVDSKAVLYLKNPDQPFFPASTTKMMTAIVARQVYDLDQIITVPEDIEAIGQVMELEVDEKITVENLLYGLLIASGNDAAEVLAQSNPEGREVFIGKMNEKAKELRLEKTTFKNPSGIEEDSHVSTTHDLAILAAEFLGDPLLSKIVKTKAITITDESGQIGHELENINELLGKVRGLKGVKTGWTENAGECLVSYVERDGRKIITVVLGSADRFGETEKLIEWAYGNHQWEEIKY